MRTIGVVTVNRSDYGIALPILRRIKEDAQLTLHLFVSGAHLSPEFGLTVRAIEADGVPIGSRVEMLEPSDAPEGIAASMGRGVAGFAEAFARNRPDLLLVVADRFEMHAAALAALPFTIPVAHLHGGELSQGAFDDALRHSITKLSHLHFVAAEPYAQRVVQMGEEPWRVTVSGAPSLDHLRTMPLLTPEALRARWSLTLEPAPLLVTYHPVTLEHEATEWQVGELLAALEAAGRPIVFTLPNPDTRGRAIARMIRAFVERHPEARLIESLGTQGYFSLMACAAAMVGNSSSGIIEAPSFGLPVVNIGTRQEGRIRGENVIDVGYGREEIVRGIRDATDPALRARLRGLPNPYGDGHAAEIIVDRLAHIPLDRRLLMKRFVDAQDRPAWQPNPLTADAAERPRCVILGGGGHARVVIDALRESGAAVPAAVLDAQPSLRGTTVLEVPVMGDDELLPTLPRQGITHFVVGLGAVGDNRPRERLFLLGLQHGLIPLTVRHPAAVCSSRATIGAGSVLCAASVVSAGAAIGRNVIVNTGAIVEHDCRIGDHAHLATGAALSGTVTVGMSAHIGAGATVRQGLTIGEAALVGAGAVVITDVPSGAVVAGVPARPLPEHVPGAARTSGTGSAGNGS